MTVKPLRGRTRATHACGDAPRRCARAELIRLGGRERPFTRYRERETRRAAAAVCTTTRVAQPIGNTSRVGRGSRPKSSRHTSDPRAVGTHDVPAGARRLTPPTATVACRYAAGGGEETRTGYLHPPEAD